MKKLNIFILLIAIVFIGCERDDICAESTPTTPRLRIEFYDATSQEDLKSVPRLTVYGEGLILDDDGMEIEPIVVSNKTIIFNSNQNTVDLPLRIDDDIEEERTITRFILEKDTNLRLDTENPETSNVDIIEISYIPKFEYVSRACGYKSIFTDVEVTLDTNNDSDTWISNNIAVDIRDVENENEIHVRIFH
ncbi:DUF6452 family protein [Winogradskyella flava]|uniref:Uncharacterized protein n=1 Tax=Winogradskyella flava TaxID=1884876 RepID=A0A842IYQ1_9FLAO|nr:DUF6452 family protein [Winogradskyella flava]MBC2846793.1 hypothetical protein [Winogradskyella flava]